MIELRVVVSKMRKKHACIAADTAKTVAPVTVFLPRKNLEGASASKASAEELPERWMKRK